MRLVLELLQWRLAVVIEPQYELVEAEPEPDESGRLSSDLAFGFTYDPAFPIYEWEEEEDGRLRR